MNRPSLPESLRLPESLADFAARGFRTDRPAARAHLEARARAFIGGFNAASAHWADVHAALDKVPPADRGLAYEGAAMYAALRRYVRPDAVGRLLDGPGRGYVHLIHVGMGWAFAGLPGAPVPMTRTPLHRWLALDGAGFAEVFLLGGLRVLRRRAAARPSPRWAARLSGCGRALWFAESADPTGIAAVIAATPPRARPELWAGVGLAAAYAGDGAGDGAPNHKLGEGNTKADLRKHPPNPSPNLLVGAAGAYGAALGQGVVFAAAARVRAGGEVPAHTERACREVLGVPAATAAAWSDEAAAGLTRRADVAAYEAWRHRIRSRVRDLTSEPVR